MKTKSTVAQCAAAIRKDLKAKFPGVTFRVRSESYSMGDNVNVSWVDGPTADEVRGVINKYEYGKFNGMEDIYEYTNRREDIPQTKFLFTERDASQERTQRAIDFLNKRFDKNLTQDERGYVAGYSEEWREHWSTIIHRMLSGYYAGGSSDMDFSK